MSVGERAALPGTAIPVLNHIITWADRWDHFQARWGVRRSLHRVPPGLYALGTPTSESPVFVTANYTLSVDAVRSSLKGVDAFLLVLDTHGINVWCAAGKGTFGTDELVRRIETVGLKDVVTHRKLILPQLGAPGVAAFDVKRLSGFQVEYGPVRAADLPEYLRSGRATPEMRRVRFTLSDRLVLIPVEIVQTFLPMLAAAVVLYLAAGLWPAIGVIVAVLAGVVAFPILLPWLPTQAFSSKGFILGLIVALPVAAAARRDGAREALWFGVGWAVALVAAMPAVTAYLALNFTGSTTFTSKTGVELEMRKYIPIMAVLGGLGLVVGLILIVVRLIGGLS